MAKTTKHNNSNAKNSKKNNNYFYDEEQLSIKDIKREKINKQYRNYNNALRAKDLDRLLSYDDE